MAGTLVGLLSRTSTRSRQRMRTRGPKCECSNPTYLSSLELPKRFSGDRVSGRPKFPLVAQDADRSTHSFEGHVPSAKGPLKQFGIDHSTGSSSAEKVAVTNSILLLKRSCLYRQGVRTTPTRKNKSTVNHRPHFNSRLLEF